MKIDEFLDNPDLQEGEGQSAEQQTSASGSSSNQSSSSQTTSSSSNSTGDALSPKQQLKSMISSFEEAVKLNDVTKAMQFYAELKHMGHMLIELNQDDREQVYQRIVASDKQLGTLLENVEKQTNQALKDLEGQYHSLAGKPYNEAKLIYQLMSQRLAKFPITAEEKKEQATITVLHAYIALLNTKQKEDRETVTNVHKQIIDIIMHAKELIHNNTFPEAKKLYEQALQIYNSLPAGYMSEKSHLYKTIISLFNEISYTEKVYALKAMIDSESISSQSAQLAEHKPESLQTHSHLHPAQSRPVIQRNIATSPTLSINRSSQSTHSSVSSIKHPGSFEEYHHIGVLIKQRKYAEASKHVTNLLQKQSHDEQALALQRIIEKAKSGAYKSQQATTPALSSASNQPHDSHLSSHSPTSLQSTQVMTKPTIPTINEQAPSFGIHSFSSSTHVSGKKPVFLSALKKKYSHFAKHTTKKN